MRPYFTIHKELRPIFDYDGRHGAVPIGGTLPQLGPRKTYECARDIANRQPEPPMLLHVTLSMPEDRSLSRTKRLTLITSSR